MSCSTTRSDAAAIANRARRRGVTAEDARLAAAHCSTVAVYAQLSGIDARAASAMRDLVQAQRRGDVDAFQIEPARTRAALKRYGVEIDERALTIPRPAHNTQQRVLEDLVGLGLTGMFGRTASTLERTAVALERRGTRVAGVTLVQDEWKTQFCEVLWLDIVRTAAEPPGPAPP